MKIHVDCSAGERTGPGTFAARLMQEFVRLGHVLHETGERSDASIVFIEPTGAPLARRVVQRLDGIWFSPEHFVAKNVRIKDLYHRADAVIWQSKFDRGMTLRWWGQPRGGCVIPNGIKLEPVQCLTIPRLKEMAAIHSAIYVCSANWHGQKRLKSNIDLFKQLHAQQPDSCLIVLGNGPDHMVADPAIYYAGSVDHATAAQVYSAASWMLHLAWADHCPNVVIEALAEGTPVVCSSVGGTKELIGDYGLVVPDGSYDYELADYDSPPNIDISHVTLPDKRSLDLSTVPDLSIERCALRYLEVLEAVQ